MIRKSLVQLLRNQLRCRRKGRGNKVETIVVSIGMLVRLKHHLVIFGRYVTVVDDSNEGE